VPDDCDEVESRKKSASVISGEGRPGVGGWRQQGGLGVGAGETVKDVFDVVICLDNALSHLLDDADLRQAARQPNSRSLSTGCLTLLGVLDQDHIQRPQPAHAGHIFAIAPFSGEDRELIWAPRLSVQTADQFPSSILNSLIRSHKKIFQRPAILPVFFA